MRPFLLLFRAVYQLTGTEEGLNFSLTDAEKAELGSVSKAGFLARVQVKKEEGVWLRTKGQSKFRGVERQGRDGKWKTKWSPKLFDSEEEAAAEYDREILATQGPTVMTNAKYYADPETRGRAWEERRRALEKAYEAGTSKQCSSGWHVKVQGNRPCCTSALSLGRWLPALWDECNIRFVRTIRFSSGSSLLRLFVKDVRL